MQNKTALEMINQFAENAIINGFNSGDETSLRQLYDLYYRPLCYFAIRLIEDKQAAEDIAVDSFLKLLQKKDFNSLNNIKSFLFTAVRNASVDHLRKKKVTEKYTRELSYLLTAAEQGSDEEMLKAKVLQTIYAEMEGLPVQCRSVFKAIFVDGKTTGDIAQEMGISKQTVLNQKTTALNTLRTKLQEQGLYTVTLFIAACSALR